MGTVSDAIDLDGLLIAAGLKEGPGSTDVVVAPNGTAATLYFAEPETGLPARIAQFLAAENWAGEVFSGDALAPCWAAGRYGDAGRGDARGRLVSTSTASAASARSFRTRRTTKTRSASASTAASARTSSARS